MSPKADKPKGSNKGFGERAQKGMAWSFVREGVSEILVFPMSMVLARILTPKDFGIAAAAAFFVQLAQRLSELGFNAAIVRAKVVEPIHLSTIFVVQLCMGALTFGLLSAASPFLASFWNLPNNNIIVIAAAAFLIAPFGAIPSALLQRNLKFRQSTTVDWFQLLVQSITNLALALLGLGYMSIIYARLASTLAAMGARVYFARWRPSLTFSKVAFREIFPSGAGFFVKRVLDYSAQNGDNLVVGRVLGLTSLGLYDKAYSTMNRFLVRLNTGGPGVMFRIFAVIHQEPERFRRAYTKVMVSASMMGFPLFAILGVMAPQIMVVMFGPQWTSAATPFALLCATGALKLLNSYASAATQAAGQIWSEVTRQVTYIALIVGLILVFKGGGVTGAALGVLVATAIMTVLMHLLLQRVTHLTWSEIARPLMPALMCSAGAAAVAVGVEWLLRLVLPQVKPWALVFCQAPPAALFVAGFVLFAPHRDLRIVVAEVLDSLMPKALRQHRWAKAYLESRGTPSLLGDATGGVQ